LRVGLIVTTYNWKEALDRCLESVSFQSRPPNEVLVADDGSRPDTATVVERWAKQLRMPVKHIWQEDRGFRKCAAVNKAVAAASGDYLVIVDGDMILHRHCIADHLAAARPGCFVQGVRALTGPETARRLLARELSAAGFFTRDLTRRRHTVRSRLLSRLFQRPYTGERGIRGCNQAFWRADLLRVNGFNEAMTGWGYEDGELASRLYHCGVRRRDLRFQALATHLYHPTRKRTGDNPNYDIMTATRSRRLTRCELGIDQYLDGQRLDERRS
jgi:glycosyltransferase involved in cell wall biosynthesis